MNSQSQTVFNKTQILELIVQGGSTSGVFNFTPQYYLNDKQIISMELFSANDVSVSPQGFPLMPSTAISKAYLNLYFTDNFDGSGIWVNNLPLWQLHRLVNGMDPYVRDLFGFNKYCIQWEKSNVTVPGGPGNGDTSSFLFNVGYIDQELGD
jgi:hypothetical protein